MREIASVLASPPARPAARSPYVWACFALLAGYAFLLAVPPIWDADTWWHLRVGEWMVRERRFPTEDMFSCFHPHRSWRSFNWLFQIVAYVIHQGLGLIGLRIFVAGVVVIGHGIWFVYALRQTRSPLAAYAALCLLIVLFDDRIRVRPHIFNYVFEGLVLLFLSRLEVPRPSRRHYAAAFFLFWIWANLHHPGAALGAAVFIVGLGLRRPSLAVSVKYASAVALALCANPYGPVLLLDGKQNIEPVHQEIGEWQPVLYYFDVGFSLHHVIAGAAPFVAASAVVVLLGMLILRPEAREATFALVRRSGAAIALLVISLLAVRFVYLSTAGLILIASAVDLHAWRRRLLLGAIVLGMLFASFDYSISKAQGGIKRYLSSLGVSIKSDHFPDSAATLIREARLSGRVFASSVWGGYLLWYARPQGGVIADGRQNMAPEIRKIFNETEDATLRDGARLASGLASLGIDIAVLPRGAFPFNHSYGWVRVAHDAVSETFLAPLSPERALVTRVVGGSDDQIQRSATRLFGTRYTKAHTATVAALTAQADHQAIHQLAEMDRLGGQDASARQRLLQHLRQTPGCVRAATELASILHDGGDPEEALALLRPAVGVEGIPAPTQSLLQHLLAHEAR